MESLTVVSNGWCRVVGRDVNRTRLHGHGRIKEVGSGSRAAAIKSLAADQQTARHLKLVKATDKMTRALRRFSVTHFGRLSEFCH